MGRNRMREWEAHSGFEVAVRYAAGFLGMCIGAAIGSILPGPGTYVGGASGAVLCERTAKFGFGSAEDISEGGRHVPEITENFKEVAIELNSVINKAKPILFLLSVVMIILGLTTIYLKIKLLILEDSENTHESKHLFCI